MLLQSNSVGHRHAELLALVDDGKRRYTVALELDPHRSRLARHAGRRLTDVPAPLAIGAAVRHRHRLPAIGLGLLGALGVVARAA